MEKRVRLKKYIPSWDAEGWKEGVYRRYAQKVINRDLWRYSNLGLSFDDMMQEAWMCFDFCVKKYYTEDSGHFMSLFKKRLFCQFWLLARDSKKENLRVFGEEDEDIVEGSFYKANRYDYNSGPLRVMIEQAPSEIKEVFKILANAPSEMVEELFTKKINNKVLCKLLGKNPNKVDLIDKFKKYFGNIQDNFGKV